MKHLHAWFVPALLALAVAGCRSQADDDATSTAQPDATPVAAREAQPAAPHADAQKPGDAPQASAPMADGKLLAKVGELAPNFALKDLDGKEHTLAQYKGKTVVLEWFSPGCPTCQFAYADGPLKTMPEDYVKRGIVWLSVNSEAPDNKAASAEMNRKFVEKYGLEAPLLFDPTGAVGRSYGAKTTPHMFVIDPQGKLAYQGALDNAPMGKTAGGAALIDYVGDAVADVEAKRTVRTPETKAYG
jgi:peroxiredoxin